MVDLAILEIIHSIMAFLITAIQWKLRLYSPLCHRMISLFSLVHKKYPCPICAFFYSQDGLCKFVITMYLNLGVKNINYCYCINILYMAPQLHLSRNFDLDIKLYYLTVPCHFKHLLNCSLTLMPHIQGQIVDIHLDKFCYSLLWLSSAILHCIVDRSITVVKTIFD